MSRVEKRDNDNGTKGKIFKVLCRQCGRSTNHVVLVSTERSGSEPYDRDISTSWSDDYQIIRCQGCDDTSFRHVHWFSEHEDRILGHDGETEKLYPTRTVLMRRAIEYSPHVQLSLRNIYEETIHAYNDKLYTLCAAGLRALVEGICADDEITSGPVVGRDGVIPRHLGTCSILKNSPERPVLSTIAH